jgi:hypothetical protein
MGNGNARANQGVHYGNFSQQWMSAGEHQFAFVFTQTGEWDGSNVMAG